MTKDLPKKTNMKKRSANKAVVKSIDTARKAGAEHNAETVDVNALVESQTELNKSPSEMLADIFSENGLMKDLMGNNPNHSHPQYQLALLDLYDIYEKRDKLNRDANMIRANAKKLGFPAAVTNALLKIMRTDPDVVANQEEDLLVGKMAAGFSLNSHDEKIAKQITAVRDDFDEE
jgi:hypothetical protein